MSLEDKTMDQPMSRRKMLKATAAALGIGALGLSYAGCHTNTDSTKQTASAYTRTDLIPTYTEYKQGFENPDPDSALATKAQIVHKNPDELKAVLKPAEKRQYDEFKRKFKDKGKGESVLSVFGNALNDGILDESLEAYPFEINLENPTEGDYAVLFLQNRYFIESANR